MSTVYMPAMCVPWQLQICVLEQNLVRCACQQDVLWDTAPQNTVCTTPLMSLCMPATESVQSIFICLFLCAQKHHQTMRNGMISGYREAAHVIASVPKVRVSLHLQAFQLRRSTSRCIAKPGALVCQTPPPMHSARPCQCSGLLRSWLEWAPVLSRAMPLLSTLLRLVK